MVENSSKIKHFFNRIFTFNGDYILPTEAFVHGKWFIKELQDRKAHLNGVKSKLNKFDLEEWSQHTKHRDPSGFVIKTLKQRFKPELLTQAWCKFYECLCQFPIVNLNQDEEEIRSLHLCEAPGAFIAALNHYIQLNYPHVKFKWTANTLNPNYEGNALSEMIPDDRLIRHTLENWFFGTDATGNITKYNNHEQLVKILPKVSIVSADGSVDCMQDPGNQEVFVEYLHFCETITALSVLRTGGSFVLKIFTMFEDSTISLLFLLTCLFEKVSAFKPSTSKSGNSEVYIISTRYKGFETVAPLIQDLLKPYKNGQFDPTKSLFSLKQIPDTFIEQIISCTDFFMQKQIQTIENNIFFFRNKQSRESCRSNHVKFLVSKHYINKYKIKSIPISSRLVPELDVLKGWRKMEAFFTFSQGFTRFETKNLINKSNKIIDIELRYGKAIDKILSSKFVYSEYLSNFSKNTSSKELFKLVQLFLSSNNVIVDFKCDKNYNYCEKELFNYIMDNLDEQKNVFFVQVPFLTHFLVGILYLLMFGFESVILFENGSMLLYDVREIDFVKQRLKIVKDGLGKCLSGLDLIQVLNPNCFDGFFYKLICYINNKIFSVR